ncbi:hypothetical protein [Proteus hauseri]|uniref:hypothetical protein n=1 Tax=Proteus hauseri TaxID=183417 RepID=UPI0032DB6597
MKAKVILKANSIEELQALGAYHELKKCIENELGTKLDVDEWNSFYKKISSIRTSINNIKNHDNLIDRSKSFSEAKVSISNIFQFDVKARSWRSLELRIQHLIHLFSINSFDPYEYYEKYKLKKFCDSSKLEGINIIIPDKSISLESVLKKYTRR